MSESIFSIFSRVAEAERAIPKNSWEEFKARRSLEIQEELFLAKHIKRGRKRQLDIYTFFLENKLKVDD